MQKQPANSIGSLEARNVYRCTAISVNPDPRKRDEFERELVNTWGKTDAQEWEHGCGRCKVCGTGIDDTPTIVVMFGETVPIPVTVCGDCMEIVRAHYSRNGEEEEITATPEWDKLCPPRFQEALGKPMLPDGVDVTAHEKALGWTMDRNKGPIMAGPPGSGKTTTLWALFRKLERGGHAPKLIGSVELGRILSNAAKDIREVSWLYNSRVLMVDDLGKEKLTASVAMLLWEVLDKRAGLGHPFIATTQFSGEELEERFGEKHLGQSIRRRMNEVSFQLAFSGGVSKQ